MHWSIMYRPMFWLGGIPDPACHPWSRVIEYMWLCALVLLSWWRYDVMRVSTPMQNDSIIRCGATITCGIFLRHSAKAVRFLREQCSWKSIERWAVAEMGRPRLRFAIFVHGVTHNAYDLGLDAFRARGRARPGARCFSERARRGSAHDTGVRTTWG